MLACHICDGTDDNCEACMGRGYIRYTECPRPLIPSEIHDFLFYYDFANKGNWPVTGGLLDQPRAFLDAVRFCRAEEAGWKAKLNLPVSEEG